MRPMKPIPLCAQRIATLAGAAGQRVDIEVLARTGSTNADLMARLERLVRPALLLAESQSAGRGRAGRPWLSEPGAALMFSLAWPFSRPLHALLGLPLAVGVALAAGLRAHGAEVRLKWPNDILLDGRKLAGVLIEGAPGVQEGAGLSWAVIGVGINIGPTIGLEQQLGAPLAGMPAQTDRNALMAALLAQLAPALERFGEQGFGAFMDDWNQLHAHAGSEVVVLDHGRLLHQGVAEGVDREGRLQLRSAAGIVSVLAGDVSLRPKGV